MKIKKPKLNVRLLRRIQKHILEEPKRLSMRALIQSKTGTPFVTDIGFTHGFAKCGTAACIARWALILSGRTPFEKVSENDNSDVRTAEILLGLTPQQGTSLCWSFNWPVQFRKDYEASRTVGKRARIAAKRIDHLIKTGE